MALPKVNIGTIANDGTGDGIRTSFNIVNNGLLEVDANTLKVGITTAQALEIIANTAKVGISPTQASDIVNNSAKVGISNTQATDISANNAKISFALADSTKLDGIPAGATVNSTDASLRDRSSHTGTQLVETISNFDSEVTANAAVALNTVKIGITSGQASDIDTNNSKVGITTGQASDIVTNLSKISFDSTSSTKLDGIDENATANDTDANLKNRVNHTGTQVAATISDLDAEVANNAAVAANTAKVSFDGTASGRLAGMEDNATSDQSDSEIKASYENNANTEAFTTSEKAKLTGLESSKFLGTYIDVGALQSNHPSPIEGSYAHVDVGSGQEVEVYIWDDSNDSYHAQAGVSSAETAASLKVKYESNANTEAFTTTEQIKLGNIATDATKNDTDANLRKRSTHTGTQLASTISDFDEKVASANSLLATVERIISETETIDINDGNGVVPKASYVGGDKSGNERGHFALDIQSQRDSDPQVGDLEVTSADYSCAFGSRNTANGTGSSAIGHRCLADAQNSIAVGFKNDSLGLESVTIGSYSEATHTSSTVIGHFGKSTANAQTVISAGGRFSGGTKAESAQIELLRSGEMKVMKTINSGSTWEDMSPWVINKLIIDLHTTNLSNIESDITDLTADKADKSLVIDSRGGVLVSSPTLNGELILHGGTIIILNDQAEGLQFIVRNTSASASAWTFQQNTSAAPDMTHTMLSAGGAVWIYYRAGNVVDIIGDTE